jgi:D-alanyl-D-alanine carboxypeptidase/D-alanyl-D-alanine-endopeptidase (penicillin-binding protein 4)
MFQKGLVVVLSMLLAVTCCKGQQLGLLVDKAMKTLSGDPQFRHAVISLELVDTKTGMTVYEKNSQLGLAAASCQKLVTSITAFELLGKGFRFRTDIGHDGTLTNGVLEGSVYLRCGGDPTLGSERWNTTSSGASLKKILDLLAKHGIKKISGDLVVDDSHFTDDALPNGWVWEDIGNYYGAGAWGLNWMENQFDVNFRPGVQKGDATIISSTRPASMLRDYNFVNFVTTGIKGSGDNAYLYSAPFQQTIIARGTVPPSAGLFTIAGSIPDPPGIFSRALKQYLADNRLPVAGEGLTNSGLQLAHRPVRKPGLIIDSILSPTLDSVNYWFLKKSVNLFGEALVKALASNNGKPPSTDSGVAVIKRFWARNGIEASALGIIDGSGLSPSNRITSHSLVTLLQFARKKTWFASFYAALPELNGIKMKDGYISGVRSYAGYLKAKDGTEYSFAFIVNNFDGSAGTVREKIWKLFDIILGR